MQYRVETAPISCPYCGEGFDIVVDYSVPQQDYVEDCYVCCRPIHLSVSVAGDTAGEFAEETDVEGGISVIARSENDC